MSTRKIVMLNDHAIGYSASRGGCEHVFNEFVLHLFGQLFRDGRNGAAVLIASFDHCAASFGVTQADLLHACTQGVVEGRTAFYIELGKPAVAAQTAEG